MYEFYFYNNCHDFNELVRKALTAGENSQTFRTVKQLLIYMESFHQCFGVFLLVDLSLMFFYWLIHLYNAYFTFQEGPLAACGSVLIIAAELWRVVLISEAGEQFTEKTNDVVSKLEDMRVSFRDKEDRQVCKYSNKNNLTCSGVQAVHEQVEAPERDVGPRVLHSEQRPGHLLPGHNIHLLGHSCTVHSGIIGEKK